MADGLMAALQSKLATYESAGMADHAKRVKARIAQLEKRPAAASAPATLSATAAPTKAAAPKKAVKTAKKRK